MARPKLHFDYGDIISDILHVIDVYIVTMSYTRFS